MTETLAGRCIIVTGAGDGVGRGVALACAAAGAHVIVGTRHENGHAVVGEIDARGGRAAWTQCDVTDEATIVAAVDLALERAGALHAIVHNATSNRSSEPHRLEDVDRALWDEHAAVSLRGAYHCARAGFEALRETQGTLILMTSPAGMEGTVGLPLYGAVKGALRGFAKSLAREWAPHGMPVNIISPLALSPAMGRAIEQDPGVGERLARRVPMGRVGDPEHDVGPAVVYLASADAHFVTGQTLAVDGGHFMNL
ncbi:MAG TPA: SDR family oxidoreductase [Acidimicrobiia bacterium]|nr:SDR family oxidoreductase [Acidimicrobiia bacterium]